MDRPNLDGRVAIVTGAANGLGEAIALGLAELGAKVLLADLEAEGLGRTEAAIERLCGPGRTRSVTGDISALEDSERIVGAAIESFGQLDLLVNNAGLGTGFTRKDFITNPISNWEVDPARWRRIIEVNAIGSYLVMRAAIPHMLARRTGRIVNVSTTWETMLRAGFGAYGASKAALEAFSLSTSRELAGTGVTVNTILPGGPADTAKVPDDIGIDRSKLLPPEVMVPPIAWLATDAAANITGRRFTAALWDPAATEEDNLARATEPAAWPGLVRPIVMRERGNLRSE
jgi:3-oxoacyl-[acyl-carrier protein] reductase